VASTGCAVILEVARLDVRPGEAEVFEAAFAEAQTIVASMQGYRWHALQRCLEETQRYLLLIAWDTLEDHTVGFRGSPRYQDWKRLLHRFYDPFPIVEHYVACAPLSSRERLLA
jgi:heme-degrading monooxygenase HmoA